MVSDSQDMRVWHVLALVAFSSAQIAIFLVISILALCLSGLVRAALIAIGGAAWLALLLFNVRLASKPRRVIQSFLNFKAKTRLSRDLKRGSTVVVKGAVSLLHEELLSTEFHNVPVSQTALSWGLQHSTPPLSIHGEQRACDPYSPVRGPSSFHPSTFSTSPMGSD